jgi:hypothetical protein
MLIILAEILGIVHFLGPETHYVLKFGSAGSVCVFKWNREIQKATVMAQFEIDGHYLGD